MNNFIKYLIAFTTGAGIGGLVTWKVVKGKYEKIADDEIEDVKSHYAEKLEVLKNEPKLAEEKKSEDKPPLAELRYDDEAEAKNEEDKSEYEELVTDLKYSGRYEWDSEDDEEEENASVDNESDSYIQKPYVIRPDDFGENEDYGQMTLYELSDGYIIDDEDQLIHDVEEKIGYENLDQMGKYEDDVIHVRNDEYEIDYEILKSDKSWADISEEE